MNLLFCPAFEGLMFMNWVQEIEICGKTDTLLLPGNIIIEVTIVFLKIEDISTAF